MYVCLCVHYAKFAYEVARLCSGRNESEKRKQRLLFMNDCIQIWHLYTSVILFSISYHIIRCFYCVILCSKKWVVCSGNDYTRMSIATFVVRLCVCVNLLSLLLLFFDDGNVMRNLTETIKKNSNNIRLLLMLRMHIVVV